MKPEPMDRSKVNSLVSSAIREAVSYIESELSDDWQKAQRYFNGKVDIAHEEGRSKVVATKCRDTVRAIKPALMRAFLATDKPVEFIPKQPDDVQAAEQATAYTQWKFQQCGGYRVVSGAIHDALIKKCGIVKVYHETRQRTVVDEYTGLTDDEFALVAGDDDITILEHEEYSDVLESEQGPAVVSLHNAKVSKTEESGEIRIIGVAPENFFINAEAETVENAYIVGDQSDDTRVGDLVAMGYDYAEVIKYAGDEDSAEQQEADLERQGHSGWDQDESSSDPTSWKVLTTEAYMAVDIEGTGIPQMYRFLCVGSEYHVLDYDLCDQKPYAAFAVDPEPHTFYGRSLVEVIEDEQDTATSMLRGMLDNIALSNSPTADVIEDQVNMEDVLNNEVGAVRRVRSMDAIRWNVVPFSAGQTLPAMQYFDEVIEGKTGVGRASMGLDPDALQNTTAAGVNAMTQASTGQVELVARNLAEGGMCDLFRIMANLVRQHADAETMMRLNGEFVPVDPRSWKADMDLVANVGLGTGGEVEREMVLRETLQHQMSIWQAYGPGNGLVSMTQIRNTLADILKMGGIQNADRYFNPMTPEQEQMLLAQAAQAAQGAQQGSDPNAAFLQAEQMKTQSRMQTDMAKLQLEGQKAMAEEQRKRAEMGMEDDLSRDRLVQELAIEVAKIMGQYGTSVDVEAVRAAQAAPRDYGQQ